MDDGSSVARAFLDALSAEDHESMTALSTSDALFLVEQQGFMTVTDGRIAAMSVVSGYRPGNGSAPA